MTMNFLNKLEYLVPLRGVAPAPPRHCSHFTVTKVLSDILKFTALIPACVYALTVH